jgi:integrase
MRTDILVPAEAQRGLVVVLPGAQEALSLDALIGAWLHSKHQRSGSDRTPAEYAAVLSDYRAELQRAGMDLDAADVRALGLIAQAWAARPRSRDGRPVSAATHNRRLAILSSFYTYAKRHGMQTTAGQPPANPVELVERARVQAYAAAQPLDTGDVAARLAAIDRAELSGKRDYALLSVALSTGRRVSELAALRWAQVSLSNGRATLTWARTKGGKVMQDRLSAPVTGALLDWLAAAYGTQALATLPGASPLWLALGRNVPSGAQRALSIDAIADVCRKWLGTSKVHATRHTFAVAMEMTGAKLTDIQARLGHSNAATTGVYLQRLHSGDNAYADDVAALFGIQGASRARSPRITRPLRKDGRQHA